MEDMDAAKRVLDKVTVVCPECGKKPANCSVTNLTDGIVKEEFTCCSGTGFVMVHTVTGYVVDTRYKKSNQPGAVPPAYIPLVFDSSAHGAGETSRTIGWIKEPLPTAATACCASAKECGFWGKVKHCLSKFWN